MWNTAWLWKNPGIRGSLLQFSSWTLGSKSKFGLIVMSISRWLVTGMGESRKVSGSWKALKKYSCVVRFYFTLPLHWTNICPNRLLYPWGTRSINSLPMGYVHSNTTVHRSFSKSEIKIYKKNTIPNNIACLVDLDGKVKWFYFFLILT